MKNHLLSPFIGAFLLTMCAVLFSCGKGGGSGSTTPVTKGHTVKYTITVVGSVSTSSAGLIVMAFTGTDANNISNSTIWAVNGVPQKNSTALGFSGTAFPQGTTTTMIITSLVPISSPLVDLTFGNVSGFPSYTISYKAEIDGIVKNDDENIVITAANEYQHDYTY